MGSWWPILGALNTLIRKAGVRSVLGSIHHRDTEGTEARGARVLVLMAWLLSIALRAS